MNQAVHEGMNFVLSYTECPWIRRERNFYYCRYIETDPDDVQQNYTKPQIPPSLQVCLIKQTDRIESATEIGRHPRGRRKTRAPELGSYWVLAECRVRWHGGGIAYSQGRWRCRKN
jgi:hypothetical protein